MSTSTVIFLPFLFLIAEETNSFIFELATWLSLIRNSSLRLNLWLVPPPNLTAYFWTTLKFGIVFLVQHILHFFPASFTNLFVFVAIPEIWDKKFKATLSAINMFWTLPWIIATSDFFFTKDPSFFFTINFIFLSIRENALFANNKPPIIASSLAINFALMVLLFFTRLEVISPEV